MFRNQYFVANFRPDTELDVRVHEFGNLFVYALPDLGVSYARIGGTEILLLGYAIDPFAPEKDDDEIAAGLASAGSVQALIHQTQVLSGRFVIFYRKGETNIVFSDTLGHRQIYYYADADRLFLTSSPKVFLHVMNFDLRISNEKRQILQSEAFRRTENAWFGDDSLDDRLKKVIPNHYLDLKRLELRRKSFDIPPQISENSIRDLLAQVLTGGLGGAVRRYQVMQAVTAGIDSRLLLAASKNHRDEIQYYIFKRPSMSLDYPDIEIPLKLARKLDIDFRPLATEPLRDDFLEAYKSEHIHPRILSKTQNIQYHYFNNRRLGNVLDVKGNGAEVLRLFYGRARDAFAHSIGPETLLTLAGHPNNPYFSSKVAQWLSDAKAFSRQYGIPILDLFYWEQRMGNWGAEHGLEQDIAIEEFWPFNNAALFLNGLKIAQSKRGRPKYAFFIELMNDIWPDVLSEPINPKKGRLRRVGSYLNGYLKSNAHLESLARRLASKLNLKR
jgi:hypothetical protein